MAGNPAFGSPAWDAKYGIKRFGGGKAPATAARPSRSGQPSLSSVAAGLRSAIASEPEPADKRALEGALATIERVARKNAAESGRKGPLSQQLRG